MLSVREADEVRYDFSGMDSLTILDDLKPDHRPVVGCDFTEGHALYIYGVTGPQMGSLEISIDGSVTSIVNLKVDSDPSRNQATQT